MFEDFLELMLTLIFESPLDDFMKKIDRKYSKFLRVVIKIAMFILFIAIIALVSFAIRGYWF